MSLYWILRNLYKEYLGEKSPVDKLREQNQAILNKNGLNICYNKYIQQDYDPDKKNILLAIESPAVIKNEGWLDPEMRFHTEVSFYNFYDLENYLCPRRLYSTNDFYVNLNSSKDYYSEKKREISMVYSDKKELEGHKFRHQVAENFGNAMDTFGSGQGSYLHYKEKSLDKYRFQVVIENGKYPEYVSEKFFDCIKTRTIPIYWGGDKAVKKLGFNTEGVLFFDSEEDLNRILNNRVSKSFYEKRKDAIEYNFKRLLEIRKEVKMNFFLNSVRSGYLHGRESYHEGDYSRMSFEIDS